MIDTDYIENLFSKAIQVQLHSFQTPIGTGALKFIFESSSNWGQSLLHYLGLKFQNEELSLTINIETETKLHIIFHSKRQDTKFKTTTKNFNIDEVNAFFNNINYIDSWVALGCYYPSSTPITNPIVVKDNLLPSKIINSLKVKIYKYEL